MRKKVKLTIQEYHNYLCKVFIIKKYKLFKCSKCNYRNTRLYHTKMHFIRIHIQNGKPIHKKRKFS